MIKAEHISVNKEGNLVMQLDAFESRQGAMTGLVGPSGSGKSTLLNCLSLLEPTHTGRLMIDGKDVTRSTNAEKRKFWEERAAFVFQDYGIVAEWTVEENVALQESSRWRGLKDLDGIRASLDAVGLADRYQEKAAKLSGGEKQRVGIARALYKNSTYIFVDEPTASLDAANRQLVISLLQDAASDGATVIVATHDEEVISACDELYRLEQPAAVNVMERGN